MMQEHNEKRTELHRLHASLYDQRCDSHCQPCTVRSRQERRLTTQPASQQEGRSNDWKYKQGTSFNNAFYVSLL